jgi:FkbM family methyltransferase
MGNGTQMIIHDLRNQPDLPQWMDYPQHEIGIGDRKFLMTSLTSKDCIVRKNWRRGQFYERKILINIRERTSNHDGCFIDIGANVGNHTVFFANFCNVKRLFSIEPHPSIFEVLKFNCDRHIPDSCKITLFNCAASNQKRIIGMGPILPGNIGTTKIVESAKKSIEVNSCTLDKLIGKERVAFIKVDVEGHEPEVFQGARTILKRDRPLIMAEAPDHGRQKALDEILEPLGYKRGSHRWVGAGNYFWNPLNNFS